MRLDPRRWWRAFALQVRGAVALRDTPHRIACGAACGLGTAFLPILGQLPLGMGRAWMLRGNVVAASIDHAMWFHRACRVDEWLLYSTDSPSASGARGFARGALYTHDGVLVASTAQEGLMRPVQPKPRA